MKTLLATSVCILLFALQAHSQESLKFGKIDIKDLEMTTYEPDSSAEAVVLWDEGISNLTYDQNRGFFIRHDRHTRIKILSTDGYDWANVTVTLYKSGTNKESVGGLRAITHYLEDGKAKSVKMEKSAIFEEEVSESATNLKFTLPNVKVGSVIEYRYELI